MPYKHTNGLISETSPYLLQHAHNPVDWYAWGDAALQKAKELNKPILVSIGYSACHWCHVMERESFEDESAAKIMNDNFINIKIDREERPDLDHIYIDAVQAMSGSGGWPLNVFLTPDTKPFFGGTYFPPVKAFNRSSWKEVLLSIATAWKERKSEIESQADNLIEYLQKANGFGQTKKTTGNLMADSISKEQCHNIFEAIMKAADKEWGGFGKAPKFPQTFVIQYLLQYHYFTGNTEALQQATLSLNKMLQGGIYDHVDGGLARYSTDAEWLAPHFEKMLYDNALLISVLCDAYQITQDNEYEKAIRKTIAFVQKELLDKPSGGFYAALDADSDGEEGKYYVWQKKEIEAILGNDAKIFCDYFEVTEDGNWEGKNILRILKPLDEFVAENNIDKFSFEQNIGESLEKLSNHRQSRIKPQLDDKIILSWNALMLNALCKAATALQEDEYKKLAEDNFNFILSNFKQDTSYEMFHTFKNGIAKTPAFLDDYAYLIKACISLYEITFDSKYINMAKEYCSYVIENFSDDNSPFFLFTHQLQNDIIIRKKEIYDGAIPSGNAIMANNLLRLSIIFDKQTWRQQAESMLVELLPLVEKYPSSFGIWSIFLMQRLVGINEISILGNNHKNIGKEITVIFIPNKIIISSFRVKQNDFPILQGKISGPDDLIYLCKDFTCFEPYKTAQDLLIKVSQINKL